MFPVKYSLRQFHCAVQAVVMFLPHCLFLELEHE